jgi:hypothetical protein
LFQARRHWVADEDTALAPAFDLILDAPVGVVLGEGSCDALSSAALGAMFNHSTP